MRQKWKRETHALNDFSIEHAETLNDNKKNLEIIVDWVTVSAF